MITHHHYRGFELDWAEDKQAYAVTLEGELVTHAETVAIGDKCIDFYYEASRVSFNLHSKRAEMAREEERENAGPEPELAVQGRPNVAWVKWYRAVTGCGLREAHQEALNRIASRLAT